MGKVRNAIRELTNNKHEQIKIHNFERAIMPSITSQNDKFMRLWGGIQTENIGKETLEQVSPADMEGIPIYDLINKLVKSDPTMDLALSVFTTLTSKEHALTATTDRGQREIDEILQMLESKKNPFSLFISHIATSIMLRGNILVEAVFVDGEVDNLYAIDPVFVEWRELVENGSARWAMGQYNDGDWQEVISPNWYWESIGALIGERTGRSPLQSAIPSILDNAAMRNSLHSVLDKMAFTRKLVKIKQLEMLKLAKDRDSAFSDKDVISLSAQADELVKDWKTMGVNDIPYFSDIMEWMTDPGAGSGLDFTDMIDRMDDRKTLRGTKTPPSIAGSNEFTAESSAKTQSIFYSSLLQGGQESMKRCVEFCFRRFLRSRGYSDDPLFTTHSVDVVSRVEEAKAFNEVMKGIKTATSSGIPIQYAIDLYEQSSGNEFDAETKQAIVKALAQPESEPTGSE